MYMKHGNNCKSQMRFPVAEDIKHFHIQLTDTWHAYLYASHYVVDVKNHSFIH